MRRKKLKRVKFLIEMEVEKDVPMMYLKSYIGRLLVWGRAPDKPLEIEWRENSIRTLTPFVIRQLGEEYS